MSTPWSFVSSSRVQVAALLHQAQLLERIGAGQLVVDRREPRIDRIRGALAAALGLVGAQRIEVIADDLALGAPGRERCLVFGGQWTLGTTLRHAAKVS